MKSIVDYSEIYDEQTVAECRLFIESTLVAMDGALKISPEKEMDIFRTDVFARVAIHFLAGERALKKEEWVRKHVQEEERREKGIRDARLWRDVICHGCYSVMEMTMKDWESSSNGKDRVLMIYQCPTRCSPGRAFYDDGQEYISKPIQCTKCLMATETAHARDGKIITTTYTCKSCGNVDTETLDLTPRPEKQPVIDEAFEEDRRKYCLSPAATEEYRQSALSLSSMKVTLDEIKKRKDGTQEVEPEIPVRMLKVIDLQALIAKTLEEAGFSKIEIGTPTTDRGVRLKLTALDTKSDRSDDMSGVAAKDALKKPLEDTNWRLIRGSLHVTLGALIGELKGVTTEAEARAIIKSEKAPKVSPKDGEIAP